MNKEPKGEHFVQPLKNFKDFNSCKYRLAKKRFIWTLVV